MGSPWRLTALSGCAEKGLGFVQIQAAGSGGLQAVIQLHGKDSENLSLLREKLTFAETFPSLHSGRSGKLMLA